MRSYISPERQAATPIFREVEEKIKVVKAFCPICNVVMLKSTKPRDGRTGWTISEYSCPKCGHTHQV